MSEQTSNHSVSVSPNLSRCLHSQSYPMQRQKTRWSTLDNLQVGKVFFNFDKILLCPESVQPEKLTRRMFEMLER